MQVAPVTACSSHLLTISKRNSDWQRSGRENYAVRFRNAVARWRSSGVAGGVHPGHFGAERFHRGAGREASKAVGLAQSQQPLSLVGPGVDGGGRLGLPEEDAVLVPLRADLGALRRVGSPGDVRQGRVEVMREGVLHTDRSSSRLRAPELSLCLLRLGEQLIESGGEGNVGEVAGFGGSADLGATLLHAA